MFILLRRIKCFRLMFIRFNRNSLVSQLAPWTICFFYRLQFSFKMPFYVHLHLFRLFLFFILTAPPEPGSLCLQVALQHFLFRHYFVYITFFILCPIPSFVFVVSRCVNTIYMA